MSCIHNAGLNGVYNEGDEFMAGQITYCASGAIPNGWLECNGAAVSRATYGTLFTAIGTNYGAGDGATTFNLPDLRGEFIRGADRGRGVDSGRAVGTTQADSMRPHTHDVAGGTTVGGTAYGLILQVGAPTTLQTGSNSGAGSETRPRNVAMISIIKYS